MLQVTVPTSLEELLETQVISEAGSVEEDASKSPWILAFLQYPGMRDEDKRQMLFFRLLTSRLLKTKTTELDVNRRILFEIQRRYFSDSKFQQPSISFTDIHNVVPQIFRSDTQDTHIDISINQCSPCSDCSTRACSRRRT